MGICPGTNECESHQDKQKVDIEHEPKRRHLRRRGDSSVEEVPKLITQITGQLLERVQKIRMRSSTFTFPNIPTSLDLTCQQRNLALEVVRNLCHVVSLHVACIEEAANLCSLLHFLGAREFVKESQSRVFDFVQKTIS